MKRKLELHIPDDHPDTAAITAALAVGAICSFRPVRDDAGRLIGIVVVAGDQVVGVVPPDAIKVQDLPAGL
jgi:hypothetical protein